MVHQDKNTRVDTQEDFTGGVDSGKQPRKLKPDQVVRSINCSFRHGYIQSRPGFIRQLVSFDTVANQNVFEKSTFQGAMFYSNPTYDQPAILAMIEGGLFRIDLQPGAFRCARVGSAVNSGKLDQAWMVAAERYAVIQDGLSGPLIYDGAVLSRSGPNQVPVGTLMAVGQGRIFVKVGTRSVRAGDIYEPGNPASILSFTETNFLNEGGDFGPSPRIGELTALVFMDVQDTATGQGPLLAYGPEGAMSFNVQEARANWKTGSFGVQALTNAGALGQDLMAHVNGDLWYRAHDGWRSYRNARGESTRWARTFMSGEVRHRIQEESEPLFPYGSAVHFDNRLISTCIPFQGSKGVEHRGLLVLDFQPTDSIRQMNEYSEFYPGTPAWSDLWTGLHVYKLIVAQVYGEERCFAFCNEAGRTVLYEISKNDPFDNYGETDQRIVSSFETRAFAFKDDKELKKLVGGDAWFSALAGRVDVKVQYRPDEYPKWYDWHTFSKEAQYLPDPAQGVLALDRFDLPFVPRAQLPQPFREEDLNTSRTTDLGYTFQVRYELTGYWQMSRLRLLALSVPEKKGYQGQDG